MIQRTSLTPLSPVIVDVFRIRSISEYKGVELPGRTGLRQYAKVRTRVSEWEGGKLLLRRLGAKQNWNRRSSMYITLGGVIRGRCGVGGAIVAGVVWFGNRARSWALHTFPLFLLSFPLKVIIEMAIGSEDLRESRSRRSRV